MACKSQFLGKILSWGNIFTLFVFCFFLCVLAMRYLVMAFILLGRFEMVNTMLEWSIASILLETRIPHLVHFTAPAFKWGMLLLPHHGSPIHCRYLSSIVNPSQATRGRKRRSREEGQATKAYPPMVSPKSIQGTTRSFMRGKNAFSWALVLIVHQNFYCLLIQSRFFNILSTFETIVWQFVNDFDIQIRKHLIFI